MLNLFIIVSGKRACSNCKHFIKGPKYNPVEYGKCGCFGEKQQKGILYEYASHCRLNDFMCGNEGTLFEYDSMY